MKRRFIIRLGLLVLAGAIVNVAVAWALALWAPASEPFSYRNDRRADVHWLGPVPPRWPKAEEQWMLNSRGLNVIIVAGRDTSPSTTGAQAIIKRYRQQRFAAGL